MLALCQRPNSTMAMISASCATRFRGGSWPAAERYSRESRRIATCASASKRPMDWWRQMAARNFRYPESQGLGRSDRNVGVSGEVEEQLQTVTECEAPHIGPAQWWPSNPLTMLSPARIPCPSSLANCIMKAPMAIRRKPSHDIVPCRGLFGAELRQHVRHAAYGPGDRDREKRHVQGELGKVGSSSSPR